MLVYHRRKLSWIHLSHLYGFKSFSKYAYECDADETCHILEIRDSATSISGGGRAGESPDNSPLPINNLQFKFPLIIDF